jgi:hypothetical protein
VQKDHGLALALVVVVNALALADIGIVTYGDGRIFHGGWG